MPAASTATVRPQPAFARLSAVMASRPLCVALAVTAMISALRLVDTVDSDVAWQVWIAERIHSGAHLYRDIIEVNPPLWFWMAIPVERAAAVLHVPIVPLLIAVIGAVVGLALVATERLTKDFSPARRTVLLAFAAVTLTAMPWMHTGQREQIVLIGTLPYAALIAARGEGKRVPVLLAILVGLGAPLGFALKHYFLIVPLLLELWLLAMRGRNYRPVRPETIGIVAVGIAYAVSLLVFAPDWLTRIVPLIRLAYGATGAPRFIDLFGPFTIAGLLIVAAGASQHKRLGGAPLAGTLLVTAFGFTAAFFMQAKGWPYHAIPMIGCASLSLVVLLGEEGAPRLLGLTAPALLAFPLLLAADDEMHPALPSPDLLEAVSGLHRGDTVGFLATEPALAWSITLQRGYRFPSRYMGYWMMNAIVRNEASGSPDPRLAALGRRIVSETVDDFRCAPPKRIIVWRPRPAQTDFDMLSFLLRDPQFAELLSHYRVLSRTSLETYQQVSPLLAPRAPCRRGV